MAIWPARWPSWLRYRLGRDPRAWTPRGCRRCPTTSTALTMVALMARAPARASSWAPRWCRCRPSIRLRLRARRLSMHAVTGGRLALGVGPSHHWIIRDMLGLALREAGRLHPRLPAGAQRRRSPARDRLTSRTIRSRCTTRRRSGAGGTDAGAGRRARAGDAAALPASGPTAPCCGWPTSVRSAEHVVAADHQGRRQTPGARRRASSRASRSASVRLQ